MTTTDAWDQQTEQAWEALESRLGTWLHDVPLDETVFIGLAWPEDDGEEAAPYVQLDIEGLIVRSEAASNHYLEPRFQLDETRVEQLSALGWRTAGEDGNFWREDEVPGDAFELAASLVATLRDIYGVPAPSFLVTSGFGETGPLTAEELPFGLTVTEPDGPSVDLTATIAEDADELRDLVAAVVSSVANVEVEFDPDGDIPMPAGNTVVYVRVEENEPAVTLFAALLRDVSWTPRVGHTLNDVNKTIRYGRTVFHAGHVLLEYRLFCRPFVPEVLRHAVHGITGLVDGLDVRMQGIIGGRISSDHQDGVA